MQIILGDCLEQLRNLKDCSIDSLVTDPPAGIGFMGKEWDHHKGGRDAWIAWMTEIMIEAKRILKPGAHGLVWALPRTSHWTATALENAGFEVRDIVNHIFGTGFPKSLDISKAINKAAGEVRSSDYVPNYKNNDYGKGMGGGAWNAKSEPAKTFEAKQWKGWGTALKPACEHWILVRKPIEEKTVAANVLKHGTGGLNIDASRIPGQFESGWSKSGSKASENLSMSGANYHRDPKPDNPQGRFPANLFLDEYASQVLAEQARFFYVAKASKLDRGIDNTHPTVKSLSLMQCLIRLITPKNGTVLDPFMGSGSTGVAAKYLGFGFVGIEKEPEYFEIAKRRIGVEQ